MTSGSVARSASHPPPPHALSLKAASDGLFFLDEAQWEAIAVHLPVRQRGPKRLDDRIVISGILQVLQSGCAWRDCPREYGPYMTVFNRYLRWTKRGIWQAIFDELLHNQRLPRLSFRARPTQTPSPIRMASGEAMARNESAAHLRDLEGSRSVSSFGPLERTRAEAELQAILRTDEDTSREIWIEPIIDWHMRRAMLPQPDPENAAVSGSGANARTDVGQGLDDRLGRLIALFESDYVDAKTRLISALECINFYAAGGVDRGAAAQRMLDFLLSSPDASSCDP